MNKKKAYGLLTAISMIVGIVIGSGIYFRADDVFVYTNGNIGLGLLVLALGAMCITFGSLTLSTLAKRSEGPGGLVDYFSTFVSEKMGAGFGWFQMLVYSPAISVIVGWAGAIYTFMLLGIESTLLQQVLLGMSYNMFFILLNVLSRKLGGYFQTIVTAIKIIPLILIAVYGIFFARPITDLSPSSLSFGQEFSKFAWISALVPLAYSYDGWAISLNIAAEVVNPKKNMTKALVVSPIIILSIYLAYIYGIGNMLGADRIIELGDSAIFEAGKMILGERLGNVLLAVVVLSVLGVTNGLNLGSIRMPQALAEKRMFPDKGLAYLDPDKMVSIKSAIFVAFLEIGWAFIHYFVMSKKLFGGRDISEISIVFSYLSYLILYKVAFDIIKKENKAKIIFPILATLGSLMILIGSLIASPFYVSGFILISAFVMFLGYRYKAKIEKN